ncbi:MAG: HAD-IIIC family phosphatase [Bryobacteraceae bacterium]|nr:HAD-IIIC family phosphatase [Bryobacteraceae bacterium]
MDVTLHPAEPFRIAISASFTAEPLEPFLLFWGRRLNTPFEAVFAPYNQILQTLLDPGSVFASNRHGVNVILLRAVDLAAQPEGGEPRRSVLASHARELAAAVRASLPRFSVPLLFLLCPSPGDEECGEAESILQEALGGVAGLHFFHPSAILSQYPVAQVHDPRAAEIARIPYTEEMFAALATVVARRAHTLSAPPYKVIAVDLDNTLWRGICGEDGPAGVVLDPPRRFLHEFLLRQREAGMLLVIASKNNFSDVQETFLAHPEFPLRLEHFAAWRIDWNPKPVNLASLAAELNVGLDSFIFLDDNPMECAEVASSAPEVLSITLPANLEELPAFLAHVWAFDHPNVTEEDRRRAEMIARSLEFSRAAQSAASLDDFIASLNLRVDVQPLDPERLPRAAQLTQRTNQFNTTTIRRTEAEIAALAATPGVRIFTAEVSDRFGEYGLTGLAIVFTRLNELYVDSFLLSCRVLGRGVEHRILARLAELALDEGIYTVTVPFTPTAKNAPARAFLDSIPFGVRHEDNGGYVYRFPATELQTLRWTPSAAAPPETPRASAAAPQARAFTGYAEIAASLRTPAQVLQAARQEAAGRHAPARAALFHSATEEKLARIWSELLQKPVTGPEANFFDLGGHSLLAVLLLMRVREEFGIELSVDEVYSGSLTLGSLAAVIEARQLGAADPDEYQALLAEIENLSDEEVRALLERELGQEE